MKPLIICTTVLIEKSPQALPLGAACIASALKHDKATADMFDVVLASVSAEDKAYVQAAGSGGEGAYLADSVLASGTPSFVCFSVYVWNRDVIERACAELKERAPGVCIIAGGPEITADPFSCTLFDYTVAGEGESAVPALIALLASGAQSPLPQGIYRPSAENARTSFAHADPPDTETLVSPWLDGTIDPCGYEGALWELARGCPFRCAYCYESKGGKKVRYFPMKRIEAELDFFARKKVPQVFVLDPTYNADRKRALSMLKLIKQKTPGTFYYFEGRAEFIDRELAQAFTMIPCSLQIGLQSAHEDVLAEVHRTLDKKLFIRNVGYLNDAGVVFGFDLIYGLPGDTLSGFRESIDFAMSLYPNNLELFCLSVLPGTDLHDSASSLGLVWNEKPPYHVVRTDKFSGEDISRCASLSDACEFFYNQGRAVPWFNSVLRPLHMKASAFFADFAARRASQPGSLSDDAHACMNHEAVEKVQIDFIRMKYEEKHLSKLVNAAEDIIRLNGALSRTQSDGVTQRVRLHYHADDVMSEYASDIGYFAENAEKHPCAAQTFMTPDGADWKETR